MSHDESGQSGGFSAPATAAPAQRPRLSLSADEAGRIAELLGRLSSAQVPLSDLLRGLAEENPDRAHRQTLRQLADRIAAGESVAEVLVPLLESADPALTGTAKAILKSRDPAATIFRMLEYRRERADLVRHFWISLVYPIVLFVVSSFMLGAMFKIVADLVTPLVGSFGLVMPPVSRAMTGIAERLDSLGWIGPFLPGLAGVAALLCVMRWITGDLRGFPDLAHSFRMLADLEDARCTLPESLTLCGVVAGGKLRIAYEDMAEQVRGGSTLADAFESQRRFPQPVHRLVRWSEAAGAGSAEGLRVAADVFDAWGKSRARLIGAMFTVFVITFVFWMLLLIGSGIYAPMIQMIRLLSG